MKVVGVAFTAGGVGVLCGAVSATSSSSAEVAPVVAAGAEASAGLDHRSPLVPLWCTKYTVALSCENVGA